MKTQNRYDDRYEVHVMPIYSTAYAHFVSPKNDHLNRIVSAIVSVESLEKGQPEPFSSHRIDCSESGINAIRFAPLPTSVTMITYCYDYQYRDTLPIRPNPRRSRIVSAPLLGGMGGIVS